MTEIIEHGMKKVVRDIEEKLVGNQNGSECIGMECGKVAVEGIRSNAHHRNLFQGYGMHREGKIQRISFPLDTVKQNRSGMK